MGPHSPKAHKKNPSQSQSQPSFLFYSILDPPCSGHRQERKKQGTIPKNCSPSFQLLSRYSFDIMITLNYSKGSYCFCFCSYLLPNTGTRLIVPSHSVYRDGIFFLPFMCSLPALLNFIEPYHTYHGISMHTAHHPTLFSNNTKECTHRTSMQYHLLFLSLIFLYFF